MEPSYWSLECVKESDTALLSANALLEQSSSPGPTHLNVSVTYQRKGSAYNGFNRCFGVKPEFFSFNGSCDPNGVPNGSGEWKDSDRNGEYLIGTWKEGLPEAPFQSREYLVSANHSNFTTSHLLFI